MRTIVRNGRIVTAIDDYSADILIEDGRIRAIGNDLEVGSDAQTVDASNLLVLPGGVDVHTHLDWEFGASHTADTFGTGTMAAAFGGTTTIVDFANQARGMSPLAGFDNWLSRAKSACIDVGAHMIMLDINDAALADMKTLIREGVTSFKMFTAYPGVLMVDDGQLFRAMRVAGANGAMTCVHCENGPVIQVLIEEALAQGHTGPKYHMLTRPTLMEAEATHRAIRIAELAEAPVYCVHMSAAEALQSLAEARDRGIAAHGETCPHYLFLTLEEYDRPDFDAAKFVMTPPLRTHSHQDAMWRGLRTNDIQVISTDHCPFCFHERALGAKYSKELGRDDFSRIPNGAPGIETRLSLVYDGGVRTGRISLHRMVDLTATAPAKLFGLFPRKGTIAVGSDADLVLFDPNERWAIRAADHHSRVEYSLYEGRPIIGRVKKVLLRGDVIVDGAMWLGREGMGEFIKRGASGGLQ